MKELDKIMIKYLLFVNTAMIGLFVLTGYNGIASIYLLTILIVCVIAHLQEVKR